MWIILLALAAIVLLLIFRHVPLPVTRPFALGIVGAIAAFVILTQTVLIVPPGFVAVEVLLGSVRSTVRDEGLSLVNPLSSFRLMPVRRESVNFTSNNGDAPSVLAISGDRNTLVIDASLPFFLAPEHAWRLYQQVGDAPAIRVSLVLPAARSAIRASVARFGWAEASVERRDEVARAIQLELEQLVAADLERARFSPQEARQAIRFAPVLLRDVRPDEKVLNAISEKVASEEDLNRQRILTEIAKQEAERRANEGIGVARLFAELPQGFSPEQIRAVLGALADKQRADALMKAVETGKVSAMVLPSSTPVALSVP